MASKIKIDPVGVNVKSKFIQEPGYRRPYSEPRLEAMGNIRDLTLGGSAGELDSGAAYVEEPPGGAFGLPELDLEQ